MGPLDGLTVVEFAGLGPAPFAAMMLADLGARVVTIDRAGDGALLGLERDTLRRGRAAFETLDLKAPADIARALALVDEADVLIEGFRPGVMERLGLGPEVCRARRPGLVYARMTGWGQTGPWATTAGHDLAYIATTGALHAIGEAERPVPPLNLLGDFGGGAMLLVTGILAALFERSRSGLGQVVDAAIVDGTVLLTAMIRSLAAEGKWRDVRAANLLDGGAAAYRTYPCADGRFLAVAPLERKFFVAFATGIGLDPDAFPDHLDPAVGPVLAAAIGERLLTRGRDDWAALFDGTDACVAPVLALEEAPHHPHAVARGLFVPVAGGHAPAPAPRFDRTPTWSAAERATAGD